MRARYLPVFAFVFVCGCSKVHEERSFTIDPLGGHSIEVSAPLSEQTVSVQVTADNPVSVWIILGKSVTGRLDDIDPSKLTSGIITSEKDVKEAKLVATIPAKEKYVVLVNGAKKTDTKVTVKIDSQ